MCSLPLGAKEGEDVAGAAGEAGEAVMAGVVGVGGEAGVEGEQRQAQHQPPGLRHQPGSHRHRHRHAALAGSGPSNKINIFHSSG